jgi:hypothetical protein
MLPPVATTKPGAPLAGMVEINSFFSSRKVPTAPGGGMPVPPRSLAHGALSGGQG